MPVIGPFLNISMDIFNEPSFVKGDVFCGWLQGGLNLLMFATCLTTVYFALIDVRSVSYASIAIFTLISMKNVWRDVQEFTGRIYFSKKGYKEVESEPILDKESSE